MTRKKLKSAEDRERRKANAKAQKAEEGKKDAEGFFHLLSHS